MEDPVTGRTFRIEPTYWPDSGPAIALRKTGIQIRASVEGGSGVLSLRLGEKRKFALTAHGGRPPYRWTLDPVARHLGRHPDPANGALSGRDILASAPLACGAPWRPLASPVGTISGSGISLVGNLLMVDGASLSVGSYDVAVGVTDSEEIFEERTLRLEVLPADTLPLRLASSRLAPCYPGLAYQSSLEARGGVPPIEWEVADLPEGLACDCLSGTISGAIPRAAARRSERLLTVTVADRSGGRVSQRVRLAIVDLADYCEVPAGACLVGYHETPPRAHELNRLGLRELVERTKASGLPPGEVYLPRYFIKRHPVTNRAWQEFVRAANYSAEPRRWAEPDFDWAQERDLPVTDITCKDMLAYCAWRGSRLPSGWEWEKAARGADGRLFPWGDGYDVNLCNGPELHWGAPTPVDQFPEGASPFGARDLSGNVWECVRQFQSPFGHWRPVLRGGWFGGGVGDLLACGGALADDRWHWALEAGAIRLTPARPAADPHMGFRDVVEVEDVPAYPQGWVPLPGSHFLLPGTATEIHVRAVLLARYAVRSTPSTTFKAASWRMVETLRRGPMAGWPRKVAARVPRMKPSISSIAFSPACPRKMSSSSSTRVIARWRANSPCCPMAPDRGI